MAAPNSLQRPLFTDNSGDGMKIPRPKPEDVRRRLPNGGGTKPATRTKKKTGARRS